MQMHVLDTFGLSGTDIESECLSARRTENCIPNAYTRSGKRIIINEWNEHESGG